MPPTGLICLNPTWEPLGHPELSHCPLATLGGTFLAPRRGGNFAALSEQARRLVILPAVLVQPNGRPPSWKTGRQWRETLKWGCFQGCPGDPSGLFGPARFALEAAWEDALQASYPDKPLMGAF